MICLSTTCTIYVTSCQNERIRDNWGVSSKSLRLISSHSNTSIRIKLRTLSLSLFLTILKHDCSGILHCFRELYICTVDSLLSIDSTRMFALLYDYVVVYVHSWYKAVCTRSLQKKKIATVALCTIMKIDQNHNENWSKSQHGKLVSSGTVS